MIVSYLWKMHFKIRDESASKFGMGCNIFLPWVPHLPASYRIFLKPNPTIPWIPILPISHISSTNTSLLPASWGKISFHFRPMCLVISYHIWGIVLKYLISLNFFLFKQFISHGVSFSLKIFFLKILINLWTSQTIFLLPPSSVSWSHWRRNHGPLWLRFYTQKPLTRYLNLWGIHQTQLLFEFGYLPLPQSDFLGGWFSYTAIVLFSKK